MIVVNKGIHPHNSLGMISKAMEIFKIEPPSISNKTTLPRILNGEGKEEYRRDYNKLPTCKRRNFGLSYKSFKDKKDYVRAMKEAQKYDDKRQLNEFIEEQVNGGFSFDCESVFI